MLHGKEISLKVSRYFFNGLYTEKKIFFRGLRGPDSEDRIVLLQLGFPNGMVQR
jgi:hypothetical protein